MSASSKSNLLVFVIFRPDTPPDERYLIHHEYYFDRSENPTVMDLYHAARGRMLVDQYDMKPRLDFDTLLKKIKHRTFLHQDWTVEYQYEEAVVGNTLFGRRHFVNSPHLKEQRTEYPERSPMRCNHVPEILSTLSLPFPTYRDELVITDEMRADLRRQLAECGYFRLLVRIQKNPRTAKYYVDYERAIDKIVAEGK